MHHPHNDRHRPIQKTKGYDRNKNQAPHSNDTAGNVTHIPAFGPNQRIPIFVGGFFLLPENSNFSALPATVHKAVDHVNDLTGILDGYELRMRGSLTNVSVIFNG